MGRLYRLTVDVETTCQNDFMDGSIFDASVVVVAAVAYLQRFVLDVGFLLEEGVGKEVLSLVLLGTFQAERTCRAEVPAPSTTHFEVTFLVKGSLVATAISGRYKIFEVDGTFPSSVLVARILVVARYTVCSVHVCTNYVVVQVLVSRHN